MSRIYNEEWGQCNHCGRDIPVSHGRWSKRFGWLCIRHFEGTQPDEIPYFNRPYESVRRSNAPLTNTVTEGGQVKDREDISTTLTYVFKDRINGNHYNVDFKKTGEISTELNASPSGIIHNVWRINNNWLFYVSGGFMATGNWLAPHSTICPLEVLNRAYIDGKGILHGVST